MRVRSGGQTLGEHPSRDELSAFLRGWLVIYRKLLEASDPLAPPPQGC